MPIIGLPKLLESSINTILDSCRITSWNIRGETENLQISIRFAIVDTETSPYIEPSNITYRKVPPCQVRRDKERLMMRNKPDQVDNGFDNLIITKEASTLISNNQYDDSICNTMSPLQAQVQVDGMTDTPCPQQSATIMDTHSEEDLVHTRDQHCTVSDSKQYEPSNVNTDEVLVSSGHNTYTLKKWCYVCHVPVSNSDLIRC